MVKVPAFGIFRLADFSRVPSSAARVPLDDAAGRLKVDGLAAGRNASGRLRVFTSKVSEPPLRVLR